MIRFAIGARRWLMIPVVLLTMLNGCTDVPTAPETSGGGTVSTPPAGPQVLKISAAGAVSWVPMPTANPTSTPIIIAEDPVGGGAAETDPLSVTARIDGAQGGTVVCGHFVAKIPPGAFEGVGDVTMSMRDRSLMIVDLEVSPSTLNGFAVPVELSLRTDGTTADLDSLDIYWWDPSADQWTAMAAQKSTALEPVPLDASQTTDTVEGVRLLLNHFSKYAAGKAGW